MQIGYARVSTDDQNLDLQMDALEKQSCDKILTDEGVSGLKTKRPGLDEALDMIKPGDVLLVWRLDRLGRSLHHLISIVEQLKSMGAGFKSLSEHIDTTTPSGKFFFTLPALWLSWSVQSYQNVQKLVWKLQGNVVRSWAVLDV